ncbi:hypothetical protein [Anaerosalibacter bizertensis]|uniref:hypothetical protein n=1 Tax=Anaerosalibacter bizertensis TaxID=932217 RepID=UPI001D015F54|nr:hypothetical protein [Anaerosalibacter bizertensis]MCB5559944.1 hypothetical protein [Anaerosalibacter bizertensis]MCG4585180.1 hypothetical protein [Anaerosalibacter bizertensis]
MIYFCYGAVPDILENKYKVKVNVDPAARLLGGFDFFGSWVGRYKDGIIIYYYLIKGDTIKVLKNTTIYQEPLDLYEVDPKIKIAPQSFMYI